MSQQLTVIQSFHAPLPHLPSRRNENDYRRITSTADSTANTDPPAAWRRESSGVLARYAQGALPNSNSYLDPGNAFLKFAPLDDGCNFLDSEGDVFAAAIPYLINPVNVAISQIIPPGSLTMSCEQKHGNSRTDLRWTFHMRNGRHHTTSRTIAVLELKAKDVLNFGEFEYAMATNDQEERQKQTDARIPGITGDTGTLFRGNAFWLMKQASKYVLGLDVADIAIFDWQNMLILDYSTFDPDRRRPKLPKGIWITENARTTVDHQNLYTFRAMLFGFLLRALYRHGCIREIN